MMVITKKLVFALVLGLGISGSAFAQKDKDQKNPPKGPPPVIEPKPKPPPGKDDPKPKKPNSAMVFWRTDTGEDA